MDEIIETEEDRVHDLALEVKLKVNIKKQVFLSDFMFDHRAQFPDDDPGVTRRLAESNAHAKTEKFIVEALNEIITDKIRQEIPAVFFKVTREVKSMLPKPRKKKTLRKSKRKTKAKLREEMEVASISLHKGTIHGELLVPGIRAKKSVKLAYKSDSLNKRRPQRRGKRAHFVERLENQELLDLNAREINIAIQLANRRNEEIQKSFPGDPPKVPKTPLMDFFHSTPQKTGRRPRKDWRREIGI